MLRSVAVQLAENYNSHPNCLGCGGRLGDDDNDPRAWPCLWCAKCICDWCASTHTQTHKSDKVKGDVWNV